MKALILSAGSSIHTAKWANGLSRAGLRITLATQHPPNQGYDEGIDIIEFPNRGDRGYLAMIPRLRRIARRTTPDIVNAHFASGYGLTGRFLGYHPYLLSVWGSDVYRFPERSALHRWLTIGNLAAADVIASTSHCMATRVRELVPDCGAIPVTPFGVDMESFNGVHAIAADNKGPLVIGTVKGMEDIYGIDTLIDAFALVLEILDSDFDGPPVKLRLRLVGDGSRVETLKQRAADRGVSNLVDFTGPVPHSAVPDEIGRIDIFVALSREESFGVAVLEAGAAGRPVVVSDASGLVEVVRNDITGTVVPKEDSAAAADAILDLVRNPGKRLAFGQAAREHVRQSYAWDPCLANMLSVYEDTVRSFRSKNTVL